MRKTIPFVIASIVLAGCSGGSAQTKGEDPSSSVVAPGQAIADAGILAGIVIDDQNAPIGGARIGLKEAPVEATSDGAGRFSIENLAPGEYQVFAQKLGFEAKALRVTITALATTEVTILLDPVPIAEPYVEMTPKSITIDLGLGWSVGGDSGQGCPVAGVACNSAAYPGANTLFKVDDAKEAPLATIVFEASWTPNSAVCAKTLRLRLYSPGSNTGNPSADNPGHWTNDPHERWTITNPVVMVIPRAPDGTKDAIDSPERMELNGGDTLNVKGDWTGRTFPPGRGLTNLPADLNCFTQQKIDLWLSSFYLEPAPVGYSARADA